VGEPDSKPSGHPEYCILYRVVCDDQNARCHRRISLDEPRRVPTDGTYHLRGNKLIPDLDDFLRDLPRTAFIVYRDYFCEKGTRHSLLGNSSKPGTKFFREIISVVSVELHSILQQRSMFAPDHDAYKVSEYESRSYKSSSALSAAPSEYSHRFLYHHRPVLNAEAATAADESPIKTLVAYLLSSPDVMYRKCDDLFSRGMVTQDTLPWLFYPNDILVSSQGSLHMGYVLRRVPMEGSTLRLLCWNWGYDGHRFSRKDTTLTVDIPSYGEMRINQLAVYPLRFATQEVAEKISKNGEKFWSLSRQVLISYEGPDYREERIYVRKTSPSNPTG